MDPFPCPAFPCPLTRQAKSPRFLANLRLHPSPLQLPDVLQADQDAVDELRT